MLSKELVIGSRYSLEIKNTVKDLKVYFRITITPAGEMTTAYRTAGKRTVIYGRSD